MSPAQIRSAERALSVGTWAITFGAVLYSVLTVTPLMAGHTPKGWEWTAPILPLVVDAAVVIVVRMDATLARLNGDGGRWPVVLRWMTGLMTVLLNVGLSALDRDPVGVAVHAVAPLLLIVTAETSLAYRRAIGAALAAREAAERAERELREQRAEARRREERADRMERFEAAERGERERREHEARLAREQREHDAGMARDQREESARREAAAHEEKARQEAAAQAERERREREASERERRERVARAERERGEREAAERARAELLSAGPAVERLSEERAREVVKAAVEAGLPQRQAVELTGWSVGWIAARYKEHPAVRPALHAVPTTTAEEQAS
ncbi:DUF2637 domain-containing protein [Kitasatospora purpeofusca]|uniref:DUF2637 domain-containing protein n=1 Tax=Kitasatospora purpeofusca TaxID=67352 RepID=UPI002251EC2C|nr:DUF2637 domain-containing protein [Kitasatospora purpeofusca]MCX4685242.1 DUF2637 domain-containing protein [Kitasatospora purpeofusca]